VTRRQEVPLPTRGTPFTRRSICVVATLIVVLAACAIHANFSLELIPGEQPSGFPVVKLLTKPTDNDHLGAEYYNIAESMVAGEGFANPFKDKTGPTAWMPPVLPSFLAALLWLSDGNRDAVTTIVVFTQLGTLMITGVLVVVLAWQTAPRAGAVVAAGLFLVGVLAESRQWFTQTHDYFLVLLAMDLMVAGFVWGAPLTTPWRAAGWGLCGGFIALVSPVAAFAWGGLCVVLMIRSRALKAGTLAIVVAALTVAPWVARHYLVFGRLIPIKSNLAYELWQSQCATPHGLLSGSVFETHPYTTDGDERQQYKALGEMGYLDRKGEVFCDAVESDPVDFLDRVLCRALRATVGYTPDDRVEALRRPWLLGARRGLHALPFLALLLLLWTAFRQRSQPVAPTVHWIGMGAFVLYLLPYIAISYYDRYAMPLLAVKVLLVVWAVDCLLCGRNRQVNSHP
jgi:hypothetical protein